MSNINKDDKEDYTVINLAPAEINKNKKSETEKYLENKARLNNDQLKEPGF